MDVAQLEAMLSEGRDGLSFEDHMEDLSPFSMGRLNFAFAVLGAVVISFGVLGFVSFIEVRACDLYRRHIHTPDYKDLGGRSYSRLIDRNADSIPKPTVWIPLASQYLAFWMCLSGVMPLRLKHAGLKCHPAWVFIPLLNVGLLVVCLVASGTE